ncbi:MAG: LuxR C-terminal-related transcriptional regulator [Cytophagales bacterium]|nr:LuxR C-terminal-related transcriptional regulator [Cytophagales bacterium]
MQYLFIEELLRLFFDNCDNDPKLFITRFDQSDHIIGYNYCCDERRFTHVSKSFKKILGYHEQNILNNGNFTSKIIHERDQEVILSCLRDPDKKDSEKNANFRRYSQVRCRARHIRGYWKNLMVFSNGYWNKLNRTADKIGVIVSERAGDHKDARSKNNHPESGNPFWKYRNSTSQFSDLVVSHISPRESEILELISNGMVTKEIASRLNISDSTVITHRKNLISKLKVRNTAELIKKATRFLLI